jgi:hypothetical protein
MEPPAVDPALINGNPELMKLASELREAGRRLARVDLGPVTRTDVSVRGLSWRCELIAKANLMRGQEILRFAVLAVNEHAFLVACLLARALDETVAAVVYARRSIERAVRAGDPAALEELLAQLAVGNRYMAERHGEPSRASINVLTMVDEVGKRLAEIVPEAKGGKSAYRDDYDFFSEFAHPSGGSFAAYQRIEGETTVFSRSNPQPSAGIGAPLNALAFAARFLVDEAEALMRTGDLPPEWPGAAPDR